jgi:NAD(P)-dependent dehydrogenase (short-subunit alcohol dehydrogenase family)
MQNANWSAADIPDQSGRVAIVTGAAAGIGKEAARILAQKGTRVILAVRNMEKGRAAADEMRRSAPDAGITVRELDLANLSSIKAFAERILAEESRLDLLIDNAGVMFTPYAATKDGFELQMGTNHLGHFALTLRLLPLLRATPGSRIVVVSSLAHKTGKPDLGDLDWQKRRYNTHQAYCDSKLANLLFVRELARKLQETGDNIRVTAAHPGWTRTELQRHSGMLQLLNHLLSQAPSMGALPTLRAACDPQAQSGDFFGPSRHFEMHGPPVKVSTDGRARDGELAKRLWAASEALTGVSW